VKNAGLLFLLFASLGRLSAQVTVEIMTTQDEFLPGEAIPVIARVTNRSGQTLRFSHDQPWLKFVVQANAGYVGLKTSEPTIDEDITLESSERADVRVNLAPYFQLGRPGHYQISANINVPEWKRQIHSDPKSIDVINGARIWQQEFGVPKSPGDTNPVPEMRLYALQEANYLRKHLILYVQVTDSAGKVNKVQPIGPMISFGQPEATVDKLSNLHVLYQNGPHSFSYTITNPDCEIIARQTYEYTSHPRMVPDAQGKITIDGGTRLISRDDFPPSKSSAGNNVPAPTLP
jgi:hypothetical protein